jgi:hypothetical protein
LTTSALLAPRRRPARSDSATPAPDQRCAAAPIAPGWRAPRRSAPARAAWDPAGAQQWWLPCSSTDPTKPATNQRLSTLALRQAACYIDS